MAEWKIENIVVSVTLNVHIPLEKLSAELPNTEYNPEHFPGLVLRIKNSKGKVISSLVFRSGKLIITGARSMEEIKDALKKIIEHLEKIGIKVTGKPEIEVQNMVASGKLDFNVNLEEMIEKLENVEYEPEQFPGLVYKIPGIRATFLIFKNGKIVCTGAKSEKEIEESIKMLEKKLKEAGVVS